MTALREVKVRVASFALPQRCCLAIRRRRIKEIGHALTEEKRKVLCVCTQLLEAGVDLSFRQILRALPIFPSIAQSAGRANRHGEGTVAEVVVFPYVRADGSDMRACVYRDLTVRSQTDMILKRWPVLPEDELAAALMTYYDGYDEEQRNTASLDLFRQAAKGTWSQLAGIEPFKSGGTAVDVFVPVPDPWLSEKMQTLMRRFAPDGPAQLLGRYFDRDYRRTLGFLDKKAPFRATSAVYGTGSGEIRRRNCDQVLRDGRLAVRPQRFGRLSSGNWPCPSPGLFRGRSTRRGNKHYVKQTPCN